MKKHILCLGDPNTHGYCADPGGCAGGGIRFNASAPCIALGMERLVRKCMSVDCWGDRQPNILIVSPPHIGDELDDPCMGVHCAEISRQLAHRLAELIVSIL